MIQTGSLRESKEGQAHSPNVPYDKVHKGCQQKRKKISPSTPRGKVQKGFTREQVIKSKVTFTRKSSAGSTAVAY